MRSAGSGALHDAFMYALDRKHKRLNPHSSRLCTYLEYWACRKFINLLRAKIARQGVIRLPARAQVHHDELDAPAFTDEDGHEVTLGDLIPYTSSSETGDGWLRQLPQHLRTIARLMAAGCNQVEIGQEFGYSKGWTQLRLDDAKANARAQITFLTAYLLDKETDPVCREFIKEYGLYNLHGIKHLTRSRPSNHQSKPRTKRAKKPSDVIFSQCDGIPRHFSGKPVAVTVKTNGAKPGYQNKGKVWISRFRHHDAKPKYPPPENVAQWVSRDQPKRPELDWDVDGHRPIKPAMLEALSKVRRRADWTKPTITEAGFRRGCYRALSRGDLVYHDRQLPKITNKIKFSDAPTPGVPECPPQGVP
jgi:hypothetical protein